MSYKKKYFVLCALVMLINVFYVGVDSGIACAKPMKVFRESTAKESKMANECVEAARDFARCERYADAIDTYTKAIDLDKNVGVYAERAYCRMKMGGNIELALLDAETAIKHNYPEYGLADMVQAECRFINGDYQGAAKYYNNLLESPFVNEQMIRNGAECYERMGKYIEAAPFYLVLLCANPNDAFALRGQEKVKADIEEVERQYYIDMESNELKAPECFSAEGTSFETDVSSPDVFDVMPSVPQISVPIDGEMEQLTEYKNVVRKSSQEDNEYSEELVRELAKEIDNSLSVIDDASATLGTEIVEYLIDETSKYMCSDLVERMSPGTYALIEKYNPENIIDVLHSWGREQPGNESYNSNSTVDITKEIFSKTDDAWITSKIAGFIFGDDYTASGIKMREKCGKFATANKFIGRLFGPIGNMLQAGELVNIINGPIYECLVKDFHVSPSKLKYLRLFASKEVEGKPRRCRGSLGTDGMGDRVIPIYMPDIDVSGKGDLFKGECLDDSFLLQWLGRDFPTKVKRIRLVGIRGEQWHYGYSHITINVLKKGYHSDSELDSTRRFEIELGDGNCPRFEFRYMGAKVVTHIQSGPGPKGTIVGGYIELKQTPKGFTAKYVDAYGRQQLYMKSDNFEEGFVPSIYSMDMGCGVHMYAIS